MPGDGSEVHQGEHEGRKKENMTSLNAQRHDITQRHQ